MFSADHTTRLGWLAGRSEVPIERIRFVSESDESLLQEIDCGVLFIMAFWSGSSVTNFVHMTRVLGKLDPSGSLQFVVADIDGAESLCKGLLARKTFSGFGGYGEAAWIHQGRVISIAGATGCDPSFFESNIRDLMQLCSARHSREP